MRKFIANFILLLLLVAPGKVFSQAWLADRASREGPGILLGDSLVLHPGLGVEGGYDTNPLRYNQNVEGAGRLRFTPYLDLATRAEKRRVEDQGVIEATPPKISFRLGLAGYYDMYFSEDEAVDEQDHFGADTYITFVLFPEGAFSLLADATYSRSLQPYESPAEHWAWDQVRPGIGFKITPGGGTLSFEAGYRLTLLIFEDNGLGDRMNKMTHETRFITSWKILPKTALVSKITFAPISYTGDATQKTDSMPVRGLIGLQGLLTPRFGLSLYAGYGASFYSEGDNFDSFLLNGELMFFITPTANIRLGGQRDFVDSFYANFYTQTGGYLSYEQMFGGIVLASLKGDVYHRGYAELIDDDPTDDYIPSTANRDEIWIGANLLVEFRATEWLSFYGSGGFHQNISDFAYDPAPGVTDTGRMKVEFMRFEVFGGVRGHY